MDDLISRQAAIDAINRICPIDTECDGVLLDRVDVRCVLTDLPSAQPKRQRGKWMTVENPNYSPFDCSAGKISVCSVCGYAREQYDFNYCPNCGADMREERAEKKEEAAASYNPCLTCSQINNTFCDCSKR